MSDTRTYIRLHDGMPDHPKVDPLSDSAFRLLVTTWCWSSRHLTDGVVPIKVWQKRGKPSARRELEQAGLAEVVGDDVVMHDYTEHQRTKEEVDDLRAKRSAAGRKGGRAKAHNVASAKASAKQNGAIDRDIDRSASNEALPGTPDGALARFDEFWALYPRKVDKGHAVKAWKAATKKADPDTILAGLREQLPSIAMERRTDGDFRPHPATWLNGERWTDEVDGAPPPDDPYAHIPLIRGGER